MMQWKIIDGQNQTKKILAEITVINQQLEFHYVIDINIDIKSRDFNFRVSYISRVINVAKIAKIAKFIGCWRREMARSDKN